MRRWGLVVLLVLLAAALSCSLVEYGRSTLTTHTGYREVWSRPDMPLLYSLEVADMISAPGDPDTVMAVATFRGLFARPGVPRLAALLSGIVLPVLLLLTAAGLAARRRWIQVPLVWIAAAFLAGMMLDMPAKYFSGVSAADVQQQISACAIYVTKVEAGMNCLGTHPCFRTPYYAFTTGVYAAEGGPRILAIGLGIVVPGLLVVGSLALALRRRARKLVP